MLRCALLGLHLIDSLLHARSSKCCCHSCHMHCSVDLLLCAVQYYAFVEEKQKVHCLNTLFSKVSILSAYVAAIL